MATEKNLKKLTIHKLKKKTYNALAEKPVDELVMLTDVGGQVAEITEASADYVGEIVQYVGETNDTYTNGFFYKCVETDGVYSWTQVNVQEGGGSSLPDQTDNAGKFLTTDGTTASWSDKPLVNKSTNSTSYAVTTSNNSLTTTVGYSVCLGDTSTIKSPRSVVVGFAAGTGTSVTDSEGQIAIGPQAFSGGIGAIALGGMATAGGWPLNNYAIALGSRAVSKADYAIQLGSTGSSTTNTDANTFKVANSNGNFEMLSADGTIPTDRYTTTPTDAGTYIPKLTIAEDGTATREWGTESGGAGGDYLLKTDAAATYLPLSGGSIKYLTITNNANYIGFKLSGAYTLSLRPANPSYNTTLSGLGLSETILVFGWDNWSANYKLLLDTGTQKLFPYADNSFSLGLSERRWGNIYTYKLNNGADLLVPTEGGTLARIEDINAAVGDISTALTAILGE